ncbi:MAG: acyl-CoA synthetase [Rubritepida sp.]|jgi:acyl-CoA synthetase (AMP-forming)/AMP-acid ligase II|nr:acyl-CoA synthetase [Rubritepida sp.]
MIPTTNLGRLLTQTARRLPDSPALIWRERVWTWAEMDARVDRLAAALRVRGVGPGDRVLVHARNSNVMFESAWACWKAGAVWVPTNVRLAPGEAAFLAASSGAVAMLRDHGFAGHAAAVREAAPACRVFLAIGDAGEGEEEVEAAMAAAAPPPADHEAEVAPDHPCWFFFTSGTTGRPKGAVLTHAQINFVINNHLADLMPGLSERDASLVIAPLSHGAGMHALMQVARGTPSILLPGERFDPGEAWRLIARHRVTNMFTVPTILTMLAEHPDAAPHALRHVIYAGAPMYRADQKRALERMGPCLVQYYGLGEVTGNITVLRPDQHALEDDDPRAGSCGMARTGIDIAILDEAGRRQPPGATGEVCVRGPAVFAGYFGNAEATAKAFQGGWFRTGDLGHLDAQGFLFLTGRASDMFISGGSNIYPREVEEALLTHPAVLECAVVGLPHPKWGEAGVACVVLREGQAAEAPELLAHLGQLLARYKHPLRMVFWNALPKSAYGKVPKAMLRERLAAEGVAFEP